MVLNPSRASIFLRAHTRVETRGKKKKEKSEVEWKPPDKWARGVLVLDCETTTDIQQNLTFLWWRFCELKNGIYVCQQEGVVHADNLDKSSINIIRDFVRGKQAEVAKGCPKKISLQSRTEFVKGEFWDALVAGASIVCFNAPFDLSRLPLEYRIARNKNTGWSMVLWKERAKQQFKPKLRIKPKDSRAAFISLAGGEPTNRAIYAGRFLDLSVLGWALRNKHMTLDGALESFGLDPKIDEGATGTVSEKELIYGRTDVKRTTELLNAMKSEYDGFSLDLRPERAMSAASITKAFLEKMQIIEPAKKYKLPDEILGKCMQAYYGGRSEIRIRHTEVPVVVCDATSEYPSVAVLLDLCRLLTAGEIEMVDCTEEAQNLLHHMKPEEMLDKSSWKDLAFFALIKPSGNVLPVRSLYGKTDTNIGINPLTSEEPVWYAGPDLAAAKLLGPTPQILKAFKLVPRGTQPGMKSMTIGSRLINPNVDDIFQAIIEERKKLPENHPHSLLLKIIANSLYGILAELNKYEYGKNAAKRLECFLGGTHILAAVAVSWNNQDVGNFPSRRFDHRRRAINISHFRMACDEARGGSYLLTDTDSMLIVASEKGGPVPCHCPDGSSTVNALTWKQVEDICEQLNGLNPYDRKIVGNILKIEKCNRDQDGNQQQLYGLAVSTKRYVVYRRNGHCLEIIKPSEHGFGDRLCS